MVHRALHALGPESGSLLFIENVGNLVCPALFDLGEHSKVVVISVTEGADKPLKYPHMFAAAGLVIINKIDLMPYVDFDLEKCAGYARSVNPGVNILPLSATTGEGVQAWYEWITSQAHPSANADMSQVSVDKTKPPE
jgi:hydrogenase nickel incorporation protein HypB